MTAYDLASRFIGEVKERPGDLHDPFIQWCLASCQGFDGDTPDEVPWCSAFVNRICWILRLDRSGKANARSWLTVGRPVKSDEALLANDIVVLWRGSKEAATGHVGLFAGFSNGSVRLLAGNHSNGVSIALFPASQILGIRRVSKSSVITLS